MIITKEKLKKHIDDFPDEISIEEVIERLIFIEKLEERLQQSDKNETVDEDQLKSEIQQWFTLNG
ncbi:hypothetical protein [Epilithonimonas caeni]|uniref:hypothetical protein n=1 Tax=Epilithonimonas caeni TaxID=365343 RepID=UPI0003FCDA69|nr:hypothetical protein [Epilithonimonas caeni]